MRIIYNRKYCNAIFFKFGKRFLTFLAKTVLEAKTSTCSTIKENLLLYCRKFVMAVII